MKGVATVSVSVEVTVDVSVSVLVKDVVVVILKALAERKIEELSDHTHVVTVVPNVVCWVLVTSEVPVVVAVTFTMDADACVDINLRGLCKL